jgi:hypothetical protein
MLCAIKLLTVVVYAKLLQVYVLSISTASAVDQYLGWGLGAYLRVGTTKVTPLASVFTSARKY